MDDPAPDRDVATIAATMRDRPGGSPVAGFVPGPGKLLVIDHPGTRLSADRSVPVCDGRDHHAAADGGETRRARVVAALVG